MKSEDEEETTETEEDEKRNSSNSSRGGRGGKKRKIGVGCHIHSSIRYAGMLLSYERTRNNYPLVIIASI